jgi:hypothetical protein
MNSQKNAVFFLVRDADDQELNEKKGIQAINRTRLLDRFPQTAEDLIQEGALLVRHPYLHPKFEKKLLPAQKLYDALREEAELEFSEALMELGAIEIILTYSSNQNQASKIKTGAELGAFGLEVKGGEIERESEEKSGQKTWKIVLGKRKVDLDSLNEKDFFEKLVYNKNNRTLKMLFNQIKSGQAVKKFELEFKHSISRNYNLESYIKASYAALFSLEIDFERDYKENVVEIATFVAKF